MRVSDQDVKQVGSVAQLLGEALVRRSDGHTLASKDDPMSRTLGFIDRATGDIVMLGLTDAKRTMDELPMRASVLLSTCGGRRQLFEEPFMGSPWPMLVPPVHTTKRPLGVAAMADAFSLIEEHDQMVQMVELHPDDLEELRSDPAFEDAVERGGGSLGGERLWGTALIPTVERKPGSVLLVGHEGQAGVIQVG
jgi:hypothetical protein